MIGFPPWWTVGTATFPDVEKLLTVLFQPMLTNVIVGSWLPPADDYESTLAAGGAFLRIYRTGGRINRGENRDEPRVQFAALARSRDEAWELIGFVRETLEAYADGAVVPGTTAKLVSSGEVAGPQLIPELIADDRLVPITAELITWRPNGLPDYRAALGIGL